MGVHESVPQTKLRGDTNETRWNVSSIAYHTVIFVDSVLSTIRWQSYHLHRSIPAVPGPPRRPRRGQGWAILCANQRPAQLTEVSGTYATTRGVAVLLCSSMLPVIAEATASHGDIACGSSAECEQ